MAGGQTLGKPKKQNAMSNTGILGRPNILTLQAQGLVESTVQTVEQTAHGFVVGNWVRSNGVDYQFTLAQADTLGNSEAFGVVSKIVNADKFELTVGGAWRTNVPVQPAGTVLYLDPAVPGGLTITEPTTIGYISKPVCIIEASGTLAKVYNWRGQEVGNPTVIPNGNSYFDTSGTIYTLNFGETLYLPITGGSLSNIEGDNEHAFPTGTFNEIKVYVRNFTLDANPTVTLRQNGVSTALTVTPTSATIFTFTSAVAISTDDLICTELNGATSTSGLMDIANVIYTFQG